MNTKIARFLVAAGVLALELILIVLLLAIMLWPGIPFLMRVLVLFAAIIIIWIFTNTALER